MSKVIRRLNNLEHLLGQEIFYNGRNSAVADSLMLERRIILRTLRDLSVRVRWNAKKGYYV